MYSEEYKPRVLAASAPTLGRVAARATPASDEAWRMRAWAIFRLGLPATACCTRASSCGSR
jgi:hypothetical protein